MTLILIQKQQRMDQRQSDKQEKENENRKSTKADKSFNQLLLILCKLFMHCIAPKKLASTYFYFK